MSDDTAAALQFDQALMTSAFEQIAERGWRHLNLVEAARAADLPLDRTRERFGSPLALLIRLGSLADQAALAEAAGEGFAGAPAPGPRERLFDMLMRRFDVLQQHRGGVVALLRALPVDIPLGLLLTDATRRSMRWMLDGAGIDASGLRGLLRVNGLVGVWLYTLRAWQRDESPDLAGTMAALDRALDRASRFDDALRPPEDVVPQADPTLAAVLVSDDQSPPPEV